MATPNEEEDNAKIWLHSRGSSPVKLTSKTNETTVQPQQQQPSVLGGSSIYVHHSSQQSSPVTSDYSPKDTRVLEAQDNLEEALGLSDAQESLSDLSEAREQEEFRVFSSVHSSPIKSLLRGGGNTVAVGNDGQVYSLSPQKTGFLRFVFFSVLL